MATLLSTTNGGAVADAVDNFDALDKLIDFLDGTTTPTTGTLTFPWVVLKDDLITAPTPSIAGEREVYLQGQGLSGTDAIYINIRVIDNLANNTFQWQISAATGFDTGAAFNAQPGVTPISSYLTLDRQTMPFWFIANERRFICVFKIIATPVAMHAGWYLPYATPTEFPFPVYIGGNVGVESIRWDVTNYTIGNFYDGPSTNTTAAVGSLRHRDGSWKRVASFDTSTGAARPTPIGSIDAFIHPFDWKRYAITQENFIIDNEDGTYPVFPTILYTEQSSGQVYGELDGVCYVPSRGNSSESTITIGGDTYLVIDNVYRSNEVYVAILLA